MSKKKNTTSAVNFEALKETAAEMRQRLLNLIESQADFFTITGSDARDINSCCPSDGVTAANQLVESGVLQVVRPNESVDACPVNVYAFAGEIKPGENHPTFEINAEFRQKVKSTIKQNQKPRGNKMVTLIRWVLLAFVLLSLMIVGVKNFSDNSKIAGVPLTLTLVEEFDVPFSDGILIFLFHREERCDFCNNMESHIQEALTQFSINAQSGLAFRLVNMDLPKYAGLKKKYDVFTSTVVFIKVQNNEESGSFIFSDAWHLFDKKEKFIAAFKTELFKFRGEK